MTPCPWETADFSKDSPTFIFRDNRGFFFGTDYPWTRKQGEFLQRRRPFSQRHGVSQQKACVLSSTSWEADSLHVHYLLCKYESSTDNIQRGGGREWYRLWIEGGVFSCMGGDQWYVGQQRVTQMTQILEGSSMCYRGKVAATRASWTCQEQLACLIRRCKHNVDNCRC